MCMITVYITTKNRPELFERALESVLVQRVPEMEIIVVDDGSSPESALRNRLCAQRDARIVYICNQVSVGAPKSRNLAIRSATGYFVTGLDDDDVFEQGRLESFVKRWDEIRVEGGGERLGFLYSQSLVYTSEDRYFITNFPDEVNSEQLLHSNCVGNQIFTTKEKWLLAGMFDEGMPAWQDLECYFRFCSRVGRGVLVDLPTYGFYDIRGADRISTKGVDRIRSAYESFIQRHPSLSDRSRASLFMQIFSKYYGFKPDQQDIKYFFSLGPSLGQRLKFLKCRV